MTTMAGPFLIHPTSETVRLPNRERWKIGLLATCLLAFGATTMRADEPAPATPWSPPNATQLARLDRALAGWTTQFDAAENMVRRPFSSPGYHTALKGGFVHPTRDSLNYALGLLDTGRPEDLNRAIGMLAKVISLQDANPANKTYGIWSWFLEEPLEKMNPPDWNWADFNGVTLLQIARDHRSRLPAELAHAVDKAILRCCAAIKKRDVGPGYTNIAIMGSYVTLVAGEFYALPEFRDYGMQRLARNQVHTASNGTFEEYNSPAYTVIALLELSRLKAHVRDPAAQRMIDSMLRRAWEELADHFHTATRQWAGPHSRAYASLTSPTTLALIQRATHGRVSFGVDLPDREELRLPVNCPEDLEARFVSLPEPRTVTETFIKRTGTVGTTYLHPNFALGTINQGDLWNQRRALLLHLGTADKPGYLQLRFLKDGYDFASAWLTSSQREGTAVGIVTLVTDGGDTHISLDKVKNARFRAHDLRVRFELGGPAAHEARVTLADKSPSALISMGQLQVAIDVLSAQFGTSAGRVEIGQDNDHQWIDVVLAEGNERDYDLHAIKQAAVGFALSVGVQGAASAQVRDGKLSVTCGPLSVAMPVAPGPRPADDFHSPRAKGAER